MTFQSIDFGKDIVPVSQGDAFFLDTNIIVAYLYDTHEKHLACYSLIYYLLKNDIFILVSETSVGETINSLAKLLYSDDEMEKYITINGEPSNKDRSDLEFKFTRRWWTDKIVKRSSPLLGEYNKQAITKFKPLLDACHFVESNMTIIENAFNEAINTPLQSSDALIVGTAISDIGCKGMFSIDGDLNVVDSLNVFTTEVENDSFDALDIIQKLNIQDYLVDVLGLDGYHKKFKIPKPV